MKLKKGKAVYTLPEFSQILDVRVEGNQPHNQMAAHLLARVDSARLQRDQAPGFPTCYTVFMDKIEFAPSPDKPYVVKVRYMPPVEEFRVRC